MVQRYGHKERFDESGQEEGIQQHGHIVHDERGTTLIRIYEWRIERGGQLIRGRISILLPSARNAGFPSPRREIVADNHVEIASAEML